jgi:1,4-dihydroxy-2-naphthoyl-CoA hydrolase
MRIWHREVTPQSLERAADGGFAQRIGIRIAEIGADYLCATLRVTPDLHQPYGILHGGVSAALAETAGSLAASLCVDPERFMCLGQELNANHLRPVSEGVITATARPFHIGHRSQVWGIEIRDQESRLTCVSRLTMAVVPHRASAP